VLAAVVLSIASHAGAQTAAGPPPTFKSGVAALPFQVWIKDKAGRPRVGLTVADLTLKIDGTLRSFASVDELKDKPGWYVLNFVPADADRDGKNHKLELSVRGGGTLKKTLRLPKPGEKLPH
jgi:hypothetical protein